MTDDRMTETTAFYTTRRDGVLQLHREGMEWLSSGANGGRWTTDNAYNLSVPDGWPRTDLETYVADRLERAGFEERGPALLTGVDVADARGARCGSVAAVVTAGISNPAALPMDPSGGTLPQEERGDKGDDEPVGTVNILLGTTRSLSAGALANLLTVAAEAKAATLLETTGFPGTTSDAVIVGHDPAGSQTEFSGTATAIGSAARACVRDGLRASLCAHYDGSGFEDSAVVGDRADGKTADAAATENGTAVGLPNSLEDAKYGISTDVKADVFSPN
ncbi:adenosylcobinamide amidohydrolase [Halostagnicola sp. A-GB9-2]|uniref:adenosylcobinamide amidohydrolase n=1 Tax=Halostagnicola sp. A-GB9-2 TaxID=3048066 RepID=UPI0024BF37A9|nr:adenosylcobinamide amidohydrolase [Halostagnicola sp. A-GB9-2]MDJ1433902.1 adenosylcobinamide amidohydrolase [Halostagnicola sp. A-GB9-2]